MKHITWGTVSLSYCAYDTREREAERDKMIGSLRKIGCALMSTVNFNEAVRPRSFPLVDQTLFVRTPLTPSCGPILGHLRWLRLSLYLGEDNGEIP